MTKELESASWNQWLKAYLPNPCAPNRLKLYLDMNHSALEQDLGQLKTPCQPAVAKTALVGVLHCSSTVGLRMPFTVPQGKAQKVTLGTGSQPGYTEHRQEGAVPPETSTLADRGRAHYCPSSKRDRGPPAEVVHIPDAQRAQCVTLGAASWR